MSNLVSIISPIIASISAVISFMFYRFNSKSIFRPVLVFYRNNDTGIWWIENVGKAPAVNVDVIHIPKESNDKYTVICSPMSAGKAYDIPWVECPKKLIVHYTDVDDQNYLTTCDTYKNEITSNKFIEDRKNVLYEYQAREKYHANSTEVFPVGNLKISWEPQDYSQTKN